ncbi:hypothetical protein [Lichenicola sp.]|uniref:hypothetical protein n=1 Tax=Lichenicola sp. TaxID=2804529 RepID=UPI003B008ACC
MRFYYLLVGMVLVLGVVIVFAIVSTGADFLRRRRNRDEGATVIADNQTEFEADVGKDGPIL